MKNIEIIFMLMHEKRFEFDFYISREFGPRVLVREPNDGDEYFFESHENFEKWLKEKAVQ